MGGHRTSPPAAPPPQVFRALRKSHDNEKRLLKKCRELNAEIVGGAAKVQAALKLSDEDQATIAALKKEIENSWRMVDGSHEKARRGGGGGLDVGGRTWVRAGVRRWALHGGAVHLRCLLGSCWVEPHFSRSPCVKRLPQELKAKEQIAQLKLEISNLTKLLEQGAAVGLAEVRGEERD